MITLSLCLLAIVALHSILFWALYLCVVLLRISDAKVEVRKPGIMFRQQRYVECYLGLLSTEEKSRWYNIFLKHSLDIGLAVSTALFLTLVAAAFGGLR